MTHREPRTHDYSKPTWGHAVETVSRRDEGKRMHVGGFGRDVAVGDFLILPNGERTTRYVVDVISYMVDPVDQWFADVTFSPRPRAAPDDAATPRGL